METSSRMEFLAVGLKSNNCSDVSHAIVRETMTAITIQSLTSGVNISNMTRLFPLRTLLRISLRQDFIAQHEYFKDGNMFLPAPIFFFNFFYLETGWQQLACFRRTQKCLEFLRCVIFARNCKFANLTQYNMRYIPCNSKQGFLSIKTAPMYNNR